MVARHLQQRESILDAVVGGERLADEAGEGECAIAERRYDCLLAQNDALGFDQRGNRYTPLMCRLLVRGKGGAIPRAWLSRACENS